MDCFDLSARPSTLGAVSVNLRRHASCPPTGRDGIARITLCGLKTLGGVSRKGRAGRSRPALWSGSGMPWIWGVPDPEA
jgi:hypothetical protein